MINWELIQQSMYAFAWGTLITLQISVISSSIGFCLGTALGLVQHSGPRFMQRLVTLYVTIIRGTPMLIQITLLYYALLQSGIGISAYWSAILAIGCNSGAYISQIVRSGIGSVSKGQIEAAHVLGFTKAQIARYIVLPQAMRTVLPALGNEFVTLIKDSSLASTIGVVELFKQGSIIVSRSYDYVTIYVAVGLIYLFITSICSLMVAYLEQRTNYAQH